MTPKLVKTSQFPNETGSSTKSSYLSYIKTPTVPIMWKKFRKNASTIFSSGEVIGLLLVEKSLCNKVFLLSKYLQVDYR